MTKLKVIASFQILIVVLRLLLFFMWFSTANTAGDSAGVVNSIQFSLIGTFVVFGFPAIVLVLSLIQITFASKKYSDSKFSFWAGIVGILSIFPIFYYMLALIVGIILNIIFLSVDDAQNDY